MSSSPRGILQGSDSSADESYVRESGGLSTSGKILLSVISVALVAAVVIPIVWLNSENDNDKEIFEYQVGSRRFFFHLVIPEMWILGLRIFFISGYGGFRLWGKSF